MTGTTQPQGALVPRLLGTALLGTVLYYTLPLVAPMPNGPGWEQALWSVGAVATLGGIFGVVRELGAVATRIVRTFKTLRPRQTDASARWLTARQARKAGLGGTEGLFLGILEGQPIFIANGVHGLLCAPARKGKTTGFVMPALCHDIGASRIVADMKGELLYQTGDLIRTQHGHEIIPVNPTHKFGMGNRPYNPMQIILDDLEEAREDAMADAWSMALQLYPPAPGGERDPYWPNGSRKLLVFVIVALCALREAHEANLPRVFEVLGSNDDFRTLLADARKSTILGGELATLAENIAGTRKLNPEHFESFREGAMQRLVPFGPSGHLAASIDSCGFRFRELKERRITLFLVCDYSRMDVFAPWLGLLVWAALKELVRQDNDVPVHFLLDEFTNYRLSGLPNALTALGGYGLHFWMVVQELQEITRAYGKEALATILSQTDVKQFFGVASQDTAKLVSDMLGSQEWLAESFGLSGSVFSTPSLNLGPRAKPLLTPDQVRRLPEDEQIIFVRNLPPIRALKVGYQEVAPWRSDVKPNPLHGGKVFLGRVKLRVRGARLRVTRAGRRMVERVKRPLIRPLLISLAPLVPGPPMIVLILAALTVWSFGWPYLRVEYAQTYSWCRYLGPPLVTRPLVRAGRANCSPVIWQK